MTDILDRAISPADAVAKLADKGIRVSKRTLRLRARELGACRMFGNAMFLLPEHLDRIFAEPAPRIPPNRNIAVPHLPMVDTDSLRARLMSKRKRKQSKRGID